MPRIKKPKNAQSCCPPEIAGTMDCCSQVGRTMMLDEPTVCVGCYTDCPCLQFFTKEQIKAVWTEHDAVMRGDAKEEAEYD